MKKILILPLALTIAVPVHANFLSEIATGLDIRMEQVHGTPRAAGQLGRDVYVHHGNILTDDYRLHIPTTMYIRAGGGFVFDDQNAMDGWTANIAIGLNMNQWFRWEMGYLQNNITLNDDSRITTHQIEGAMYFDLIRRWRGTGDIANRRPVVPFIGTGVGAGLYTGDNINSGMMWNPFVAMGVQFQISDLTGFDVTARYGWLMNADFDGRKDPTTFNIIGALRFNF